MGTEMLDEGRETLVLTLLKKKIYIYSKWLSHPEMKVYLRCMEKVGNNSLENFVQGVKGNKIKSHCNF